MEYSKKWEIIAELGRGGQGIVYRVFDSSYGIENYIRPLMENSIFGLANTHQSSKKILDGQFDMFKNAILRLIEMQDMNNYKALKVLHSPQDARDFDNAQIRIKNEIKAMAEISHPNLLKILDTDQDSKWFVSQYHPNGTLQDHLQQFVSDFPNALRAFRPLVAGVSELHKKGIVHRDIKPRNVFIDKEGGLVLGDFGLVFFADQNHTRVSGTLENVGSRDWMPAWAMGVRIEDIKPTFDVFSLGKVLWSMVSGLPILRLWYFERDEFNVEKRFPNSPFMHFANSVFAKCIVENEKDCFQDATALLSEVDSILQHIELNADLIHPQSPMRCRLCGNGYYNMIYDFGERVTHLFGTNVDGPSNFKIYSCTNCGNVQLFYSSYPYNRNFWRPK
jgi:serine/threonine protein kinase